MSQTPPPVAYSYAPGYVPAPTNTLAIVAIVCGFVFPVGGIVFGHVALGQIRRTGESGREIALVGLIAGYVLTGFILLMFVLWFVMMVAAIGIPIWFAANY